MKTRGRYAGLFAAGLLAYLSALPIELGAVRFSRTQVTGIDVQTVHVALKESMVREQFPETFRISGRDQDQWTDVTAEYTIRPELQTHLDETYERYGPDYAAFFAMDADTGAVIAYADSFRNPEDNIHGHLALHALFPAASVFKTITAAAVLDTDIAHPESILPYNGKSTSLYKKQVLNHTDHKWTRRPTLAEAFGDSVNTVFARLGVYQLGAGSLREYARRFAFNRYDVLTDLPLDLGRSDIEDDQWVLAEVASGWTNRNTLSPAHGALLASAVGGNGRIPVPYVVERLTNQYGWPVYVGEPRQLSDAIAPETVAEMRTLMRETVKSGSARRHFRGFDREGVEVGGKTGTLTGARPAGLNEWFIGYAERGDDRIAFASLTVSKEKWRVKPAYVARRFLEAYYEPH
ncbi:MAG: penicillin-binding transpeptidase domain-containing protein [Gammaproteobacteria bacterium]|nr:penicillin-binding transpeptidase domain-containing protein [Gammaproteobacteria bacterium]